MTSLIKIHLPAWQRGRRHLALACLALVSLFAVVDAASAAPTRIMSVGDSITIGAIGGVSDPWVGFTFGYRGPLYTSLTKAGYDFQFVAPPNLEPFNSTTYGPPTTITGPDLRTVDAPVNQSPVWGFGGATLQNLQSGTGPVATHGGGRTIAQAITNAQPDVVLLEAGINNIIPGTGGSSSTVNTALRTLVQTIINTKSDVKVVVAMSTPYSVSTPQLNNYNTYIQNTLISQLPLSQQDNVSIVNLYQDFILPGGGINQTMFSNIANYGIGTPPTWGNHPTRPAYEAMAGRYFTALEAILPEPVPEPATVIMGGMGLLSLIAVGYKRRRARRSSSRQGAAS